MKKSKYILAAFSIAALLIPVLCAPALAITESEVEAQVAASGKEAVSGNVLIWFLCAVAFLKVSQKIDSFMATLGVNVGRTGGSMMAEAMIAMRAVTMVTGGGRGAGSGRGTSISNGGAGKNSGTGMMGFFKGGLIGMAGRHISNSAIKTATTQTSAVHTAQSQVRQAASATAAAQTASAAPSAPNASNNSDIHIGGSTVHAGQGAIAGPTPQEGVIVAGPGASPQAMPAENVPPGSPALNEIPSQEGVIVTGSGVQPSMPPLGNAVPSSSVMDDAPSPQEGVILTGSEAPPPIPQTDAAPPEGAPVEVPPPLEGLIITNGDTSIHAPQSGDVLSGSPIVTQTQASTSGPGSERHTQGHTERAQTVHTSSSSERVQQSSRYAFGAAHTATLGGMVFSHSLQSGGSFANDVIGTVARGEVAGSITGDMAAQSLTSYMGYATPGIAGSRELPSYSDVEIGRGRITGVETTPGIAEGRSFAMYHVDQYTAPSGEYSKIVAADGTQWYKQYAQDAVERKPYMAPDDTVAYHERIIKKLPDPPKRKDRI